MKVAVIGLGAMGYGIASSLLRAGLEVRAFDLSAAIRARFTAEGGDARGSAEEAAEDANAIVIVVVNDKQTEAVLAGGVLACSAPGAVVLSCATMAPDRARALAKRVEDAGRLYVDAPLSGGAKRAAAGELTVMASGNPAALAAAKPILDAMATKAYILGEEPGIGSSFKIVNQLLAGVHIAAACEAIVFARMLGLDIAKVYEVITASAGNSWMFEDRIPHVLDGDYQPRSAVDIFTKDLGIVTDISRASRFATPIAGSALQMFLMTASAGMGRDDDSSVARLYAQIAGLDLPGDARAGS
jgi:3-hydroxyisobutyrate dehydrogenase